MREGTGARREDERGGRSRKEEEGPGDYKVCEQWPQTADRRPGPVLSLQHVTRHNQNTELEGSIWNRRGLGQV